MTNENQGWTSAKPETLEKGSPEWVKARDAMLEEWEAAKRNAAHWKQVELDLRTQFVKFTFDPGKVSGTERVELHNGYEAKAVKKVTYSLGSKTEGVSTRDAVDAALSKLEGALGDEGHFLAERLVKWTADLSVSEYKNLDEHPRGAEIKAIVGEVLTIKEATPTLEIVAPKAKR